MKKTLALFSSLLLFTGLKAQTPVIKKETVKPGTVQPGINADSLKALKNGTTIKQTDKAIKFDKTLKLTDKITKTEYLKKTNTETPLKDAVVKPGKY
jgi:hypothetical protein